MPNDKLRKKILVNPIKWRPNNQRVVARCVEIYTGADVA